MLSGVPKNFALAALRLGMRAPDKAVSRYLELEHLKQLLKLLDVNCVIDVGANRGQYAIELRRIGYRGRIVSFEPISREFETLSRVLAGDLAWRGYQFALGSANKKAMLNIPAGMTATSSLLRPAIDEKRLYTEEVEVRRLDEILPTVAAGLDRPRVFLKMDTQGFDLEVFKGAGDTVRVIAGLQSELSIRPAYHGMPSYLEALAFYETAGFELFNLTPVVRTGDGSLQEMNAFMRRRQATGRPHWYGE